MKNTMQSACLACNRHTVFIKDMHHVPYHDSRKLLLLYSCLSSNVLKCFLFFCIEVSCFISQWNMSSQFQLLLLSESFDLQPTVHTFCIMHEDDSDVPTHTNIHMRTCHTCTRHTHAAHKSRYLFLRQCTLLTDTCSVHVTHTLCAYSFVPVDVVCA